jgi:hypothetical protein
MRQIQSAESWVMARQIPNITHTVKITPKVSPSELRGPSSTNVQMQVLQMQETPSLDQCGAEAPRALSGLAPGLIKRTVLAP